MNNFFKKFIIIFIIIIAIGGATVFYFASKKDTSTIDFIIAERKDIVQEVSVTGRVKPADSVDLAFEGSGRIATVNVSISDVVSQGQLLARLENSDKRAELAKAKANVKLQQAKLEELIRGYTQEEVDVQKVKVENAKVSLRDAGNNLVVELNDAYTKADDAVRNNIDQFISSPQSFDPKIDFPISDSALKISIESGRIGIESMLDNWKDAVAILSIDSDFNIVAVDAIQNLEQVREFLDNISLAVNTLKTSSDFSQTTIDGYRSDVSMARSSVNTALSNISTAEEKMKKEDSTLALEQQELALRIAGTRAEQITAQEAKVEESVATVQVKQVDFDKTYLYTPIGGIVTTQDAKVGEIVSANEVIISIISEAKFEIEANIPEVDIAKIQINDFAEITLDAYGSDIMFMASVVSIEPAETVIEGVATYKTILQFNDKDERARSGMTANIDIKTGERSNVIAIPSRAVITKNGERIIRILDQNDNIVEIPVLTGLRSSDGYIEIIEGIREGDRVIVFLEE